jgi:hypothetical protein
MCICMWFILLCMILYWFYCSVMVTIIGLIQYSYSIHCHSIKTFFETDIIEMFEFFWLTTFFLVEVFFFQQTFGIHIGINCAPRRIRPLFVLGWLHTWLLMVKKNKKMLSPPLRRKRWFQFSHWEFSIHPAQSTYGVYISQLICYSIACGSYHEFIERGYSHQGCCWTKGSWCLCWSHHFETFKVHDLINRYGCHKWPRICSVCCNHNVFLSSFMTYHSVCNTTCANNGTGTVPFRSTWVQPRFLWGSRLLSRY